MAIRVRRAIIRFVGAASLIGAGASPALSQESSSAPDVPASMVEVYRFASETAPCSIPWTLLAGVADFASDHGRGDGLAQLTAAGDVTPSLVGPPLDGQEGRQLIDDTDQGQLDGDVSFDRAVGPFQFIPGSWRIFGGDGNNDGAADPNNVFDAVPAMRRHLCPDGQIIDIEAAIYSYNRSSAYVETVLDWALRYTGPLATAAMPIAGYALVVPAALATEPSLSRPHHDYAAFDLGIPVGTPLFAMTTGTVTTASSAGIFPNDPNRCGTTVAIAGVDGATYTYCHLSRLAVVPGQVVAAGTPIGLSGGQPGAPGAGNTTGPHLHLGIRFAGVTICPQPLLLAIYRANPLNPAIAPAVGCVQGRPAGH